MVLQGAPQNANIWGFLGRNLDPIELIMNCSNHVETQTYLPVQVRDTYYLKFTIMYSTTYLIFSTSMYKKFECNIGRGNIPIQCFHCKGDKV